MVVGPAVYKSLRYDSVSDFQMVSMVGTAGLDAGDERRTSRPGTSRSVIVQAKANPGKLNFGSPGVGTTQHFAAEYLKQLAGLDIQHVPYQVDTGRAHRSDRGRGAAGRRADPDRAGQIQAGTLRAIAVTSPQRFPTVPDIPTFAETGLPGYDVTSWYGLSFPAGTPAPIVERTNKALRTLLATEAVRGADRQGRRAGEARRRRTSSRRISSTKSIEWKAVREKAGIEQQ